MISKSKNNFFNFSDSTNLTAIIKSDASISYRDLFTKSNIIAHSLFSAGINRNNYVPLLIEDQYSFIEVVLAIWKLGAIPVPINTKMIEDEISTLIDDHNFKFLVTDKSIQFANHKHDLKISILSQLELNQIDIDQSPKPNLNLNAEAVVIFTSGSTGKPKGVVHTFSSIINSVENGNKILMHQQKDRWLASLPFYHIGGFQIICRSLFYGCSIIIPESFQTNDLIESIKSYNPTYLSLVSTQLERLIDKKAKPCECLKRSLIGGGFIDDELIYKADELGWKPFRVYGSSETASFVTAISSKEIKSKPQSIGKSFSNVKIKITAESEILIKSNSIFNKYLNDDKETSIKLIEGFYHTGDLGFVDDQGYLFIEARRTDLIVTGGENVNPIEVEKTLKLISGIKDACVFAKIDKTWGQIVVAAVVKSELSLNEKSIKENLKQKLAGYKIPKKIYFTENLPHTSLGKLERETIAKMF